MPRLEEVSKIYILVETLVDYDGWARGQARELGAFSTYPKAKIYAREILRARETKTGRKNDYYGNHYVYDVRAWIIDQPKIESVFARISVYGDEEGNPDMLDTKSSSET